MQIVVQQAKLCALQRVKARWGDGAGTGTYDSSARGRPAYDSAPSIADVEAVGAVLTPADMDAALGRVRSEHARAMGVPTIPNVSPVMSRTLMSHILTSHAGPAPPPSRT